MVMDVQERVVVISGAASGLGEACARLFVQNRAMVSLLDIEEERGEKLASELGPSAIFCKTDVTDEQSVQIAIEKTVDTFGAIHVAISCAGVSYGAKVLGKNGKISMGGFKKVIQINLMGTMHVIRSAAEQMLKNAPNEDGEKGVVLNTSSGAAWEGQVGQSAYSASKAALVGMTLPIAREFADYGIRVVTIAPGLFETPMVAGISETVKESLIGQLLFPKRMARPIEFAILAQHIVENPMLNGRTIRLDGGCTMQAR
jgi:NAD(P)-dependent dehydrogenase (short-subunit alcohol dehydrogenase family)